MRNSRATGIPDSSSVRNQPSISSGVWPGSIQTWAPMSGRGAVASGTGAGVAAGGAAAASVPHSSRAKAGSGGVFIEASGAASAGAETSTASAAARMPAACIWPRSMPCPYRMG